MLKHFEQGLKIRAATTMFARLFLADLFIHGIGGRHLDGLNDRIIRRFGTSGHHATCRSATLLLPLPRFADAAKQAHVLARRLRDLQYQPERFVKSTAEIDELLTSKKAWIARDGATHAERLRRFEEIRAINARLQPQVALELERTRAALAQRLHEVECDAVAARRDYAFCLYPEAMLREFFTQSLRSL